MAAIDWDIEYRRRWGTAQTNDGEVACGSWAAAKFNLWQRQTCDIFQQSATSGAGRNERDEAAIDGAVAAGETYAAQGTLDDGEGGGGGMAATGMHNHSRMSRAQWKRFKEASKRIQGRK